MDIKEITKLPLSQFIEQFEQEKSPEKFTEKEQGINILQWAILSTNTDVVKYLLDSYPYDLKIEVNKHILNKEGFKIINLIPLAVELFEEVRTDVSSYKDILKFLNEKGLIPEKVNLNLLSTFIDDLDDIRGFLASPYFHNLIESDLLDNNVKLVYIIMHIGSNETDTLVYDINKEKYSIDYHLKNICDKIIKIANLKIDVNKIEDLILIIENLDKLTELNQKEIEIFKSNIIKSFEDNNGINTKEELFLKITEKKLEYYKERWDDPNERDSFLYSFYKEGGLSRSLVNLLKKFGFDSNNQIPLSEKIKDVSLELRDVSLLNLTMPLLNQEEKEILVQEMINEITINKLEPSKEDNLKNTHIYEYAQKRWGGNESEKGDNTYKFVIEQPKNIFNLFNNGNFEGIKNLKYSLLNYYLSLLEEQKMINVLIDESEKNYDLTRAEITEEEFFKEHEHDIYRLDVFNFLNKFSEEMKKNFSLTLTTGVFESEIKNINNETYRANISRRTYEGDDFLRTLFNLKLEFNEINSALKQIKGIEFTSVENLINDFLDKNKDRDFSFLAEEASSSKKLDFLKEKGIFLNSECDNLKSLHNLFCNKDKNYEKTLIERGLKLDNDDLYDFLKNTYIFACYNISPRTGSVIGILLEDKIQNTVLNLFEEKINKNIYSNDVSVMLSHFNNVSYLEKISKDKSNIYRNKLLVEEVLRRLKPFKAKLMDLEKNIISFEISEDKDIQKKMRKRI